MTEKLVTLMSYFAKGVWVQKNFSQWITTIMILVNGGLAMAIIYGGPESFMPPSYEPLVDYTCGNTWIWGVAIGTAAALMCAPKKSLNVVGLWLSMVWHIVWMAAFLMAMINFEPTAITPIPAYAGFALVSATLLTARVIEPKG